MKRPFSSLFVILAVLFSSTLLHAEDLRVPPALQPWLEWVKDRHPELACATLGPERPCIWPGRLNLSLSQHQGLFSFSVVLEKKGEVPLPGGKNTWPTQVMAVAQGNDSAVRVLSRNGMPFAFLPVGEFEIRGAFSWQELPETLEVPVESGLIHLEIDGKPVAQPKIGPTGGLWLRRLAGTDETERDTLSLSVARRLRDGVPFAVDTRVVLRISGRAREIKLGNPLLPGSQPVSITSTLAYRMDGEQQILLQGKPGEHEVTIAAVLDAPPATISRAKTTIAEWPSEETWVWMPDEQLRSVQLSGGTPTDPERAELPADWRGLATFAVEEGTALTFAEVRRGESSLPPNQLTLNRKLWLDLRGNGATGATVQDSFSGAVAQGWRLNTLPGMSLGHVSLGGRDALVTGDVASGATGVELRDQTLTMMAESRLSDIAQFSAVGWDHDVTSLSLQLFLPPGWTLFEADGVDNISSSWLSSWTLLDVFVVLLIAAATSSLLGRAWGAIALGALILGHHVPYAPLLVWIHLLVCVALIRAVPETSEFRRWVYAYYIATIGMLLLHVVPFAIGQVRSGVYPQLGDTVMSFGGFDVLYGVLGGGLATILIVGASFAALTYLFKAQWKKLGLSLGVIVGVGVLIGLSSTFFAPQIYYNYDVSKEFASVSRELATLPSASAPQEVSDLAVEEAYNGPSRGYSGSGGLLSLRKQKYDYRAAKQALTAVDPHAVIQTGPGVPNWNWKQWSLNWSGPVQRDQVVKLHLLGPTTNLILSLCRVLLFSLLTYGFIVRRLKKGGFSVAVILLSVMLVPQNSQAEEFPSTELLQELEQRVIQNQCQGVCVSANRIKLEIIGEDLIISVDVTSQGAAGWPLPGPNQQYLPNSVKLDGKETLALRQDSGGTIWVRIPDGAHTLVARGTVGKRSVVTLSFASAPGVVQIEAPGWLVDGVSPTGHVQSSVQLTRVEKQEVLSPDAPQTDVALPHWYIVRREFRIGLPWNVMTTVTRLGSTERSAIAKIPLAPGESVTTDEVVVQNGIAIVNFPRESSSVVWSGSLKEEPTISFKAPAGQSLSENWVVACSSMWRCSAEGISPVASIDGGQFVSTWKPWPGEELKLTVAKPTGIDGPSLTVDSATITYKPGARLLETELQLDVRSSRGGFLKLILPEGVEVSTTTIDSQPNSLRPLGRELLLPVETGRRQFGVSWQQNWEAALVSSMPTLTLEGGAFNVTSVVQLPDKRWILFAWGPPWGPAVLFWSKLLIVILVSLILGRINFSPLRSYEWLLLMLGLATLPSAAIALPVLWFAALSFRQKRQLPMRWQFNILQLAIVGVTVASFVVLYQAVQQGLLFYPDMQVQGNSSSNSLLRWYVDAVKSETPSVSIITAPLWLWRVVMLLWSFWMVRCLLRWIVWGWNAFKDGGMWRSKEESKAVAS